MEVSRAHHMAGSGEHFTESFRMAAGAALSQHPDRLGTRYISVGW